MSLHMLLKVGIRPVPQMDFEESDGFPFGFP